MKESNTKGVFVNLSEWIDRTDAQEWPHKEGSYRFPKESLKALGMTARRANKLFRGEATPSLDEVNRLCKHYGWDPAELLVVRKAS